MLTKFQIILFELLVLIIIKIIKVIIKTNNLCNKQS